MSSRCSSSAATIEIFGILVEKICRVTATGSKKSSSVVCASRREAERIAVSVFEWERS